MNLLKDRLERGAALLEIIDQSRLDTGDPTRGEDIERALIDQAIRDLEYEAHCRRRLRFRQLARLRPL